MGNPRYTVKKGEIWFDGKNITNEAVNERSKDGIFLSFQNPLEVPGVTLSSFIRNALELKTGKRTRYMEFKKELEKKGEFDPERDDLIITSGAQQANELACKVLCDPGDILCCEAPSFIGSLNAFKSYNVELKGITLHEDGVDLKELEEAFATGKVKVFYIISNFQNPTGLTTSLGKRKAIYELAKKYSVRFFGL
jgi:bifunctional pyridoxal-dependent enzyme with beta-cystathionase and maltose regulon repressor activities